MRMPTLGGVTLITAALVGCDLFSGKEEATPPPSEPPGVDSTVQQPPGTQPADAADQSEADRPPERQVTVTPLPTRVDEPWAPVDTGTVSPGMTREEVVATWGGPATERSAGDWTYLFYRNGCEVTCGTFDVVFLQGGQVVDAIVRGRGHTYSGISSSPIGRQAEFTPPAARVPEMELAR